MAKQPQKPAPSKAAASTGPKLYPSNWGQMTHSQRQAWMKENRPNREANAPVPAPQNERPAARPSPASASAPPEGAVPVKLRVHTWRFQIGDREPVECGTLELGQRIADEMRSYENDHQEPEEDPGLEPGEGEEEDF